MARRRDTRMGGRQRGFQTTHWSQIVTLQSAGPAARAELLRLLCDRYWKPVYYYLLRKGSDNVTAEDLAQGFFEKVVIGGNLVHAVMAGMLAWSAAGAAAGLPGRPRPSRWA